LVLSHPIDTKKTALHATDPLPSTPPKEDAVMAPCGHSFSKDSIEQWLAPQGQDFCPLCKQRFASKELRPNYALRDAIERCPPSTFFAPDELTNGKSKK